MAGIEFRVDAVLGDVTAVQNLINQVNQGATLNIDTSRASQSIRQLQQQINQLQQTANNINLKGAGNIKVGGVSSGNGSGANVIAGLKQSEQAMQGYTLKAREIVRVNGQIVEGTNRFVKNNEKVAISIKKNGDNIKKSVEDMTKGAEALNKLGMDTGNTLDTSSVKDIESLKTALSSANVGWDNNTSSIKQFSQQVDGANNTITKFTTRQKSIENGVEVWKDTSYAVSTADGKLRQYGQTQNQVLNTQQSLSTMLASAIERFAVWGVAMKVWTGIGEGISNCINYAKELDSAMTNIRVVTMDTKEATDGLLKSYNQIGQELGASTTDIANGAIDWLRQGFDQADTNELVKDSTILSKLALIDNAQATEYLTSALKGYKLEAKDAIGVIDQLVSIDLEAATSAGDMAEAMSRTANMAKTTGVDMNELLGMIATTSEVTQNSASTVGNSIIPYIVELVG